jgi:hypothetical protein
LGEHVPDRLGEAAGEVDLGDLRAALAPQAALGGQVAVAVVGCLQAFRAASNSAQRKYLGPCLLIGPRASTAPD